MMILLRQKEERGFENQGKLRMIMVKLLFKTFHRLSTIKVLKNPPPTLKAALVH